MKLLSPTTGWVVRGDAPYWTHDNGVSWADITPVPPGVGRAASKFDNVFFLNAAEGWAITSHAAPAPSPLEDTASLYSIAHTANGGTSWRFTPLTYSSAGLEGTTTFPTQLFFFDSLHGWVSIGWAGLTHPGRLLATADGGQTWTWLDKSDGSGPIVFATLQDGWQIGNFVQGGLIVTHDGGKSWNQVNLVPPAEVGEAIDARFQEPPVFKDSRNGHLVVQYIGVPDTPSKLVVYATSDTGRTWQPTKTVSEAEVSGGIISFAIADSSIIVPVTDAAENTKVKTARLDGGSVDLGAAYHSVSALDFTDANGGWIMTTDGLLMTRDGGSTWKNISPGGYRPTFKRTPPVKRINSVGAPSNVVAFQPAAPKGGAHVSRHRGFDKFVVGSVTDMATWWSYSPYYDAGVYLPGVNRPTDALLNSNWVTQVTAQGWGLIPIWVGLQPPCVQQANLSLIDPATASAQGAQEAISAANAAAPLGLSGTIIYKNLESYTGTSQCYSAVIAYMNAWVSKVKSLGYLAGVYVNPAQAQRDISILSRFRTQFGSLRGITKRPFGISLDSATPNGKVTRGFINSICR